MKFRELSERQAYAEELRKLRGLRSERLVRAFATVPRDHYLGPGPWRVLVPGTRVTGYRDTASDDPRHLNHNILVAIDESRLLNNGEPAGLAFWFDALDLREGERAVHLGCGVGYYSAILAEVVGPSGRLLAIDVDPDLAARARENLARYRHVQTLHGDGGDLAPDSADAIFVNAGATHPLPVWLDALADGGRLIFPLTVSNDASVIGFGQMLRVERRGRNDLEAHFLSPVGIYPCSGARSAEANERLRGAFSCGGEAEVARLREDAHAADDDCWLHADEFCLSR